MINIFSWKDSLAHNWERWSPYAILLVAFAINTYQLGARTFHGDELHSIDEAEKLGQNFNGILYFALMHFWQMLAGSEAWLRFPAVFFSVAAVALVYCLGTALLGRRVGLLMAITLATSAFVIEYAQQNRFYTLFLLSSALVYWAFVRSVQQTTVKRLIALGAANILVLGAHFFGVLVIFSEMLSAFIITERITRRAKLIACTGAGLALLLLLVIPASQAFFYGLVARWTNPYGDPNYVGAKGISVANVAKIPLTFFFFTFGEHVHPFDLFLVIPGLGVAAFLGWRGLVTLLRHYRIGVALFVQLALLPVLLYLVFDPLSPPALQGAAPRYLIFLVPVFIFVLTAGMQSKAWLIVPLLLVNLSSLGYYFFGDWAYTDDLVNWRQVREWTSQFVTPGTTLLFDGASVSLADYYFPAGWNKTWFQPDKPVESSRAIVFSYDWHANGRLEMTRNLRTLDQRYDVTAGWSRYPLFVYVYDTSQSNTFPIEPDGRVNIPNEIYGLEFQDLRLPFTVQIGERALNVVGAFGLPRFDGVNAETIRIAPTVRARKVVLLSNLIGAGDVREGTVVATLRVESADGNVQKIPLRVGYETNIWDRLCATGNCRVAFSWHKRAALVGFQNYPDAWRDFSASVFATELDLESAQSVSALEFERVASPGKMYVWGIVLEK